MKFFTRVAFPFVVSLVAVLILISAGYFVASEWAHALWPLFIVPIGTIGLAFAFRRNFSVNCQTYVYGGAILGFIPIPVAMVLVDPIAIVLAGPVFLVQALAVIFGNWLGATKSCRTARFNIP